MVVLLGRIRRQVFKFLFRNVFESFFKGFPNRDVRNAVMAFVAPVTCAEEAQRVRDQLSLGGVFPLGKLLLDKGFEIGW